MSENEQRELLGTCMRDIVPHRLNHHVIGRCQGWEPVASPQGTCSEDGNTCPCESHGYGFVVYPRAKQPAAETTPPCKHCGLKLYWDTTNPFGARWVHHGSNFSQCGEVGDMHIAAPSEGTMPQAERPVEKACPNCYIGVISSDGRHRVGFNFQECFNSVTARAVAPVKTRPHSDGIDGACPGCEDCHPETRLTAEQFFEKWGKPKEEKALMSAPGRWFKFAESFRDKSEAGLRAKLAQQRKEIDSLRAHLEKAYQSDFDARTELAALRERERWIPVEEKQPPNAGICIGFCPPNIIGLFWRDVRDGKLITADQEMEEFKGVTRWKALQPPEAEIRASQKG